MVEVPLVVYGPHGERTVIGTADVDMVTGTVDADVTDERYIEVLKPDTTMYSFKSMRSELDRFVEATPYLSPAFPRVYLPDNEDHIIRGEN